MPKLSRITIYPIKSLDGLSVDTATPLPLGALPYDRRWAIEDVDDKFVNAKRSAQIHRVRAVFDLQAETVKLGHALDALTPALHLNEQRREIEAWLSDALDQAVHLVENVESGFPDDTDRPGPTIVSTGTLRQVCLWFPGMDLEEARRRFRANLEIDAEEPFWEDRLVVAEDQPARRFRIGQVEFEGLGICARCVVPSRHPGNGETISGFAKKFSQLRNESLPDWSPRPRFNHFYRLSVNTRMMPSEASSAISIGDTLEMIH